MKSFYVHINCVRYGCTVGTIQACTILVAYKEHVRAKLLFQFPDSTIPAILSRGGKDLVVGSSLRIIGASCFWSVCDGVSKYKLITGNNMVMIVPVSGTLLMA